MSSARWQQVKAIFEEGLDLPPSERAAFLDKKCGEDRELRSAVESLFASDQEDEPFLEPLAHGAGAAILAEVVGGDSTPAVVGHYQLLDCLGSGGMGSVHRAVRADGQYAQQVAVKLIKPGMASEDVLTRFRSERQTLANLDHPNIANLLDGGTAPNGSPFLVMEYIDGVPITTYCDEKRLTISDRLRLFQKVCRAVQYAHSRLVVHRDLKPHNILVTRDGEPKLVDFGIAKILTGLDDAAETQTLASQRFMTPQYASPEQVRGEAVTTATDVYSLGIILYELLVGRRPYDVGGLPRRDAEQLVCDINPEPPSTRVVGRDENGGKGMTSRRYDPIESAGRRGCTVDRLRRTLRGDLDTIVLTALHKDLQRRYGTADQLSEDIRRYLTGLPVRARRDSFIYRTRKFITRNRIGVAAAILVALSLSTVAVVAGISRMRIAEEMEKTQRAATTAERINEFMQDLLVVADPYDEEQIQEPAEVLAKTAQRIETEFADEPVVRAGVHHVLGTVYARLGEFDKAEHHLQSALQLRRAHLESPNRYEAETLAAMGNLYYLLDRNDEALPILETSIDILREVGLENSQVMANAVTSLAQVLDDMEQVDEARVLYQQALAVLRQTVGDKRLNTLSAMNNLAAFHARQEEYEKAKPLYLEAISDCEEAFGVEQPQCFNYRNNLASLFWRQGQYQEAAEEFRDILSTSQEVLGPDHPETLTVTANLALALNNLERYEEAEPLYQQLLAIRRAQLGPKDPTTLNTMNSLGFVYLNMGRPEQARSLLQEVYAVQSDLLPEGDTDRMVATNNYARSLVECGDYQKALKLFEELVPTAVATLTEDHWIVGVFRGYHGDCLRRMGRIEEAITVLEKAESTLKARLRPDHPRVRKVTNILEEIRGPRDKTASGAQAP